MFFAKRNPLFDNQEQGKVGSLSFRSTDIAQAGNRRVDERQSPGPLRSEMWKRT